LVDNDDCNFVLLELRLTLANKLFVSFLDFFGRYNHSVSFAYFQNLILTFLENILHTVLNRKIPNTSQRVERSSFKEKLDDFGWL
jgi:hypothetical protein